MKIVVAVVVLLRFVAVTQCKSVEDLEEVALVTGIGLDFLELRPVVLQDTRELRHRRWLLIWRGRPRSKKADRVSDCTIFGLGPRRRAR